VARPIDGKMLLTKLLDRSQFHPASFASRRATTSRFRMSLSDAGYQTANAAPLACFLVVH
jgi:hypothetical protein